MISREMAEQLEIDLWIYGACYCRMLSDGSIERIAPDKLWKTTEAVTQGAEISTELK